MVGPPPLGNGGPMVFWTVLGLGRLRNSGPGPKTEKHNFLVLEALWGGESAPKVSPPNCATFLRRTVWPTGTPGVGNRNILVFKAILAQDRQS